MFGIFSKQFRPALSLKYPPLTISMLIHPEKKQTKTEGEYSSIITQFAVAETVAADAYIK